MEEEVEDRDREEDEKKRGEMKGMERRKRRMGWVGRAPEKEGSILL